MNAEAAVFLPNSLRVNVEEIDAQHAGLFARLTALKELCVDSNELPGAEAEALFDALRQHFATEQRLAGECGLNFAAHARKHDKMLAGIAKAIAEVGEGKMDVFSVLRYIEYWFERHISEEDQVLGNNLQQVMDGMFDRDLQFSQARAATEPPHGRPAGLYHP